MDAVDTGGKYSSQHDSHQNVSRDLEKGRGGAADRPHGEQSVGTIFDAISAIQRFYVMETTSNERIPQDFFTIRQRLTFFSVGAKTGLTEILLFVVLLLTAGIYPSAAEYFNGVRFHFFTKLMLENLQFISLLIFTLYLMYMSRYYYGNVTKIALTSLLMGRCFAFIIKAIIVYFGLLWAYLYFSSDLIRVYIFGDFVSMVICFFGECIHPDQMYEYMTTYVMPLLADSAVKGAAVLVAFAILPFVTVFYKGIKNAMIERGRKNLLEDY